jgi:nucleoside-diphosphate-sugar epimerase
MKIFLTGASGFIGSKLAKRLAEDNHQLTILLRDPSKAEEFAVAGIKIIYGDILNKEALRKGMQNCDWVFHLAAYTRPASKDPDLPYRINVSGTLNILDSARENSVKKVIITSTAGTLGYSLDGTPVNETMNRPLQYHTEYERTKAIAEKKAAEYNSDKLEVIILNPTRVYGPGKLSLSNSVTRIISLYGKGLWRIIPGDGESIGNYVFIDDVVNGHILAAQYGKGGERYILGGENITYREFFNTLGDLYGKRRKLIRLKGSSLKRIVRLAGAWSGITGTPAFISNDWVDKFLQNWIVSSKKAIETLQYRVTPFRDGVEKTLLWLQSAKK